MNTDEREPTTAELHECAHICEQCEWDAVMESDHNAGKHDEEPRTDCPACDAMRPLQGSEL